VTGRLLTLYPRSWRERYGAEVAALSEELVAAGETTRLRACLDLAAGGAAEWRRLLVSRAVLVRAVTLAAVAAGLVLAVHATVHGDGIGASATRPYFDSHPAGWLLAVAEVTWVATELAEFRRGRRSQLWRERDARPGQRAFLPLALATAAAATAVVYLAPPVLPGAAIQPGKASFVVGLVMLVTGMALRRWSFTALRGRYFSFSIAVGPCPSVVTTGPYRLLRHPGHAGFLLACAGLGLMTANWAAVAVLTLLPLAMLAWRIRAEERALLAALGDEYQRYAAGHSRLIPLIW
jgi:protein-S-isoprenylcysteine O-methyltransferase Ste14